MTKFTPSFDRQEQGVALVLVLAFVLLLSGIMVAFFSRSMSERLVSNYSLSQTKADIFARGATEMIVADLQQEIVAGSSPVKMFGTGLNVFTYYEPDSTKPPGDQAVVPYRVGNKNTSGVEYKNLLKRSIYQQGFYSSSANPNLVPQRASQSSTLNPSLNGRFISPQRWNRSLLLERTNGTTPGNLTNFVTDFTPFNYTSGTFSPGSSTYNSTNSAAPDWILVTSQGGNGASKVNPPNPDNMIAGKDPVVGRYAYQIFDEGGLLDANVAGYPTSFDSPPSGTPKLDGLTAYKNNLTFADLRQIPGLDSGNNKAQPMIDTFLSYRNYASLKQSGPMSATFGTPTFNYAGLSNFYNVMIGNATGFLQTSYSSPASSSQSDHPFATRQDLIRFFNYGLAYGDATNRYNLQTALQYLATFTRDLNQPSYSPPSSSQAAGGRPVVLSASKGGNDAAGGNDDDINPNFQAIRVVTTTIRGRNDGSDLIQGEPLVKQRFALNRLAWLTYQGPSSARNTSATALSGADGDIGVMKQNGITKEFLDLGTSQNIAKFFGLVWKAGKWEYSAHSGGSISKLKDIAALSGTAARDPDFFELLKASISVGSLGKAIITPSDPVITPNGYSPAQVPAKYRYLHDNSVDYQVFQIGANIIDQFDADSFSTRIVISNGGVSQEFDGVENLPYINYFVNGMVCAEVPVPYPTGLGGTNQYPTPETGKTLIDPGAGVILQVPALWNPHDVNGSAGIPRPTNFRMVADSTDPQSAAAGGNYNKVYVGSSGSNGGGTAFSYDAGQYPQPTTYQVAYDRNGKALNASNTALTFSDVNGTLFREPTLLLRKGGDINLQSAAFPDGIKSVYPNPVVGASDAAGTGFLGIVFGAFPLRFVDKQNNLISAGASTIGIDGIASQPLVYLTYRLQYQDASGQWVTYDTKYGRATNGRVDFRWKNPGDSSPGTSIIAPGDGFIPWNWAAVSDPRTSRFGIFTGSTSYGSGGPGTPQSLGMWQAQRASLTLGKECASH